MRQTSLLDSIGEITYSPIPHEIGSKEHATYWTHPSTPDENNVLILTRVGLSISHKLDDIIERARGIDRKVWTKNFKIQTAKKWWNVMGFCCALPPLPLDPSSKKPNCAKHHPPYHRFKTRNWRKFSDTLSYVRLPTAIRNNEYVRLPTAIQTNEYEQR